MSPTQPTSGLARALLFWRRLLNAPGSVRREALYEELASLLQAGFGMRQALASLSAQGRRTDALVAVWDERVESGEPIAGGMLLHPELCEPVEAILIRAGERSGRLVEQLRGLAADLAAQRAGRRALLAKLAYPFVVLHVALCLPTIPTVLLPYGFGTWLALVVGGLLVLWGVPLLGLSAWAGMRDDPRMSQRLGGLPVVGPVIRASQTARFARTLGLLHAAGEGADVALEEAGHAASGAYLVRLDAASSHVRDGGTLAEAIALVPAAPAELRGLIATGEVSGALAEHMVRAEALFAARAATAATRAAVVAGALAFGLAVLVVLLVIVAVLGPIYGPLFDMV